MKVCLTSGAGRASTRCSRRSRWGEARRGYAEELPAEAGSIDVVISNGVINLCPDKMAVMTEIYRVLKPGGRIQIADIVVQKEVPQDAKDDIDLWSG